MRKKSTHIVKKLLKKNLPTASWRLRSSILILAFVFIVTVLSATMIVITKSDLHPILTIIT